MKRLLVALMLVIGLAACSSNVVGVRTGSIECTGPDLALTIEVWDEDASADPDATVPTVIPSHPACAVLEGQRPVYVAD